MTQTMDAHRSAHRVLVLSSRADSYAALLRESLPELAIAAVTADPEQAAAAAPGCDVALADPTLLRRALDGLPALRWAQSTWAGVDTLIKPGLRRDYVLTNVRGVFGPAMSEYVICYALMHELRGWQRHAAQQQGRWDATPPGTLRGRTMGLLGVGSIGAHIAHTARQFGMRVLGYTRGSSGCVDVECYFHPGQLVEMAAQVDYLVCTLPTTDASCALVDRAVLAALPSHAVFINVGRGAVVDEMALVEALERRSIAGAVLDVFQQEPLPSDHPLWRLPNVVITSHTAAISFPKDVVPIFVENYRRFAAGESLLYQVDFDRGY